MRVIFVVLVLFLLPSLAHASETSDQAELRLFSERVLAGKETAPTEQLLQRADLLYSEAASSIEDVFARGQWSHKEALRKSQVSIKKGAARKLRLGIRKINRSGKQVQRKKRKLRLAVASWRKKKWMFAQRLYEQQEKSLAAFYDEAYEDATRHADRVHLHVGRDPLGDHFFATMSIETPSAEDARAMKELGIDTYRVSLDWRWIQASPSAPLNWSGFDYLVRTLSREGVRVLPALHSMAEGFGSDWRELPTRTSAQRDGWERFVRGAVRRYGPGGNFWRENPTLPPLPISIWQIWNEANDHWFTSPVDPHRYTDLLRNSAVAIRSEDPGAKIMASSLFGPAKDIAGQSLRPETFWSQMQAAGAEDYYDFLSLHPYSVSGKAAIRRLQDFRNFTGNQKPLWITEIGWQSDQNTAFGVGTAEAQAQELQQVYRYVLGHHRRLNIRMLSWFAWKDAPPSIDTCSACYGSGLFYEGPGFVRKPAWYALQNIIKNR